MYQCDKLDQILVAERVEQFRDQVARRLSGELTEEEFLPLRLQNGLYLQKHAYMLRVAIPYGTLSSAQLRMLALIARRYDKGYGYFTTRQNIQFNWIKLEETPDILAQLASVNMHAIQTSGTQLAAARGSAVAAHADVPRSGAARLQPIRTPRQQVQGPHQDPRTRTRHRPICTRSRRGMAIRQGWTVDADG
jgi:sulfite reductase beta subunit-like hemoprotein